MNNPNIEPSYTQVTVTNQFDYRRILTILAIVLFVWAIFKIAYTYAFPEKSAFGLCQESYIQAVDAIYKENKAIAQKCANEYEDDIYKLNKCTSSPLPIPVNTCWEPMNGTGATTPVPPTSPTLRDEFGLTWCRFVNAKHKMPRYNLSWLAYDIACEKWIAFDVKSPWDYTIEKIWYGANLGDYIILKNSWDFRIVLAHTATSRNVGEKLHKGDIIWQTNLSWSSTWMHVHIELWYKYFTLTSPAIYGWEHDRENQWALLKHRWWDFGQPKETPYYFTSYNLWDTNQTDKTPCIGASGVDLCYLEAQGIRTMALTSDIRAKIKVKLGDKVKLEWDTWCEWEFVVQDEMNCRFRWKPCTYLKDWKEVQHPTGNVLRPGTPYYIKGDLPSKPGWACFVTKL